MVDSLQGNTGKNKHQIQTKMHVLKSVPVYVLHTFGKSSEKRTPQDFIIITTIIIISVFLGRLFMLNMLNCTEQMQIQKYKTHAYKTHKTAYVQTVMLKHATKQKKYP